MPDAGTLGLIATYKGGLGTLRRSGQDGRLINYYFRTYLKEFTRIYYFSYLNERLQDFTEDLYLLEHVRIIPKRSILPSFLYALFMPLIYRNEFSECGAFRVFQATGIFPLWQPWISGRPSLVTFGYYYSQLARILGKSWWKVLAYRMTEWCTLRFSDVLLVTTPKLQHQVLSARKGRPVALIPNGVDPNQFCPSVDSEKSLEHFATLMFVGRLEPEKNLLNLIKAAALLRMPGGTVRLLWIGEGSLEHDLREAAKQQKVELDIHSPVAHDQLAFHMQRADVFTLVSWSEGNPKVLLEAMSCALPCVVSDCEGNHVLIEEGKTGFFCDPAHPESIANAIRYVLSQPEQARAAGRRARQIIQERFNLTDLLTMESRLLKSLADGSRIRGGVEACRLHS